MNRCDRVIRDGRIRRDRAAYIARHGKSGCLEYLAKKYGLTRGGVEKIVYERRATREGESRATQQPKRYKFYRDLTDGLAYYNTRPYKDSDQFIAEIDDLDMVHSRFSDGHRFRLRDLSQKKSQDNPCRRAV